MPNPTLHTTEQVAARLGVHPGHVRRMATKLSIGQHYGRAWLFSDEDLERLRQRDTRRGRRRNEGTETT